MAIDWFDNSGDWDWIDSAVNGVSDWFSNDSSPTQPTNFGQGNDLLQPMPNRGTSKIGPLTQSGNYSDYSLGGLLGGVGDFYKNNQGWIDPAVGAVGSAYKANRASDTADKYLKDQQPGIDFSNEAIARQRAYYDPATANKAIGEDATRTAGYLTDAWAKQDQPKHASALSRGMLNSDPYARSQATTATARDKYWTEQAMPAIEDNYYNRGATLSNADAATAGMFKGSPILQQDYRNIRAKSDPWQNALLDYIG